MSSMFEYRKPAVGESQRNKLATLRETLRSLEAEHEETGQIADLKRILAARIRELESKPA
jgi:hypothetical protein